MKERGKEQENNMVKSLEYSVFKPGGNDTALVVGIIHDVNKRKEIANLLQRMYPNVEQVGFVNLDQDNAELMMTGGEFCGNATRSTAYEVLKGQLGEIMIKVSGVKNKLYAGVTKEGEAFSQMPIYSDISRIQFDPKNPQNATAELEGITHYVDFDPTQIKGLSVDEIKAKARAEMKRRGIDKGPACGIIYAEKKGGKYIIYPVVYVRDADTLYYETACGSGTTALGLTLALKEGKAIDKMPIEQPSGMDIKFSVEFDGKEFGYAQIQGTVGVLEKDKVLMPLAQVTDMEELNKALNKGGLTELYKESFNKAPYFENFSSDSIKSFFEEYVRDGNLFLAYDKDKVIGFGASLPVQSVPEIEKILIEAGVDTTKCIYMADLGVSSEYRGKGIARQLVQARIDAAPKDSLILMRTSVDNIPSQTLYRTLGFKDVVGAFQYVNSTKLGEQIADKRLFLTRSK